MLNLFPHNYGALVLSVSFCVFGFIDQTSAQASTQSSEPVRIFVGGPAVEKQLIALKADIKKETGADIEVRAMDSKEAAKFLARGQIDAISSSAPIQATFAGVDAKDFKGDSVSDFESFDLNVTHAFIGVHPDNPASGLTDDQIRGILTGSIKNWKTINGQDLPTEYHYMRSTFGLTNQLKKKYTDDKDFSGAGGAVVDRDGLMRAMQKHKGTIGFFSGKDSLQGFTPKYFPTNISYSLILISRKKPKPNAKKVIDFLKADAAKRNATAAQ